MEALNKTCQSLKKMLTDITTFVENFRLLNETVAKPEIAVDYNDLDYKNKLEFVDGVEPPLQHLTEILSRAESLVKELIDDYKEAVALNSAPKFTEINCTLRDDEDL